MTVSGAPQQGQASTVRTTLYLHLTGDAADALLPFRIDGAAAGGVQRATLADIADVAGSARVVVLVPASAVHMIEVELPVRSAARARQAAPFACEERFAEDVDGLHFALAASGSDGRWPFAVVARQVIEGWLARLAEYGLYPDRLLPDAMCLPTPEPGEWVLLGDAGEWLLRSGGQQALRCSGDALPVYLDLAGEARPERLRELQWRQSPPLPELPVPVRPQPEFGEVLDILLRHADQAPNLLQGDYAPQSDVQRHLRPWRVPAALAALLLVTMLAGTWAEGWQLRRAAAQQDAANIARFGSIFPGYGAIAAAQLPGLLGSELRRAGSQANGGDGVLTLLESYARAARAAPGLELFGAQYRERSLLLNLRGESLQLLENLRGWYAEQQAVAFEVENASAGADGVQIRIRLSPA